MKSLEITLYALLILSVIFGASALMEVYKKIVRKNNHKNWECWIIGGALSLICVEILHLAGSLYLVFHNMLGAKEWLDYILYIVLFYYCQLKLDMLVIKKLIRILCKNLIRSLGLTKEQTEEIIEAIDKKDDKKDCQ